MYVIRVIQKKRFSPGGSAIDNFWGIEILNEETGETFRPVYPYTMSDDSMPLREFVRLYEVELFDFYSNGENYSFGTFVHQDRENDTKDRFRESWFRKGVVFY